MLYASAAEDEAEVLSYKSVMDFTRSDHKPVRLCSPLPSISRAEPACAQVAALVSIPASSATRRLPYRSPYSIDSSWRLKQTIGLVLDRFVGILWCLIMLAGFNKDARCAFFLSYARSGLTRTGEQAGDRQHCARDVGSVLSPCLVVECSFVLYREALYHSQKSGSETEGRVSGIVFRKRHAMGSSGSRRRS